MLFGSRQQLAKVKHQQVTILGEVIPIKTIVRDLRVTVDLHFNMDKHVNLVCRSAFSYLRVIQKLRFSLDLWTKSTIVHSLVLSRIDYCIAMFNGIDKIQLAKMQKVINAAFQSIHCLRKYDHITALLREEG